jgi:putative oxidoreductase
MEYKLIMKLVSIILISMIFLFSGVHKIFDFNDTTLGFHQKVNGGIFSNLLTYNASQALMIIAILILLIAPALMIIGLTQTSNILLRIGSWLLIAFLIVATIVYHPITDSSQRNDMLKNLAIIGGLIMVSIQAS